MNFNWIDDEDYLDEVDNKKIALALLVRLKQRCIETEKEYRWEKRKINGVESFVRVKKK